MPPRQWTLERPTTTSSYLSKPDPPDVYHDITTKVSGIVVDARTPETLARGHVPGAIDKPHRAIDSSTASLHREMVIVPYCDGVFCNASTKAATRLTTLIFKVKGMLDSMEGWRKEGYPVEETVIQMTAPTSH